MSRDNKAENLKPNTTSTADTQNLSGNIWRDMRETRSEVSLATPASLTLKDTATPKATGDINLTTGTNRNTANVLPDVELFDSAAPAPARKDVQSESVQLMDTTNKGATDSAQQKINSMTWETQSEILVGNYNGAKK